MVGKVEKSDELYCMANAPLGIDANVGHSARNASSVRTSANDVAYVAKWTGTDWQFLGPNLNVDTERYANDVRVAADSQGRLVASWNEYSDPDSLESGVVVRRFNEA